MKSPLANCSSCIRAALFLFALGAAWGEFGAFAQEAYQPLQFRRVYAPADRAKELASEGTWTVRRDEFERLIQTVNDGAIGGRAALQSRLDSMTLRARYSPSQHALVEGVGFVQVAHQGETTAAIPLGSFRMAIESAWWKEAPETAVRIVLGPDGALLLLADRSGEVEIRWSHQGKLQGRGSRFDLEFISCPHLTFEIQTPIDYSATASQGVLTKGQTLTDSGEATELNVQLWNLAGPASGETTLLVEPTATDEATTTTIPRMRRASTYELNERGLRYGGRLQINAAPGSIDSIPLRVDAGLSLTSAWLGDEQVEISSADSDGLHWLHFAEPVGGENLSLRIQGAGVATSDPQSLPRVVVPQFEWVDESVVLEVASPIQLISLGASGCRQTQFEEVGAALKRYRFDAFDPEYSISFHAGKPNEEITATSLVRAHWGRANISADWLTTVNVLSGVRYNAQLPVPPGWIVDSIQTEPPDQLESWRVDQQGREIHLEFKSGVATDQPLKIAGRAYRRTSADPLATKDFTFGTILGSSTSEHIVAITTDSADELHVIGGEKAEFLSVEAFNEAATLQVGPPALVFRDTAADDAARFELRSKDPYFSANLVLRAELGESTCTQQWKILCKPEGAPLTHVDLRFQPPLGECVNWSIVDDESAQLIAEPLESTDAYDVWRIQLTRSNLAEFELQASVVRPHSGVYEVSLASIENADEQNGAVILGSPDGASISVKSSGMAATPMAIGAQFTDRQTLVYNPAGRSNLELQRPINGGQLTAARIWRHRLVTFWGDSSMLHQSEARLENFGASDISATLPPGSTLKSLLVNGAPVAFETGANEESKSQRRIPLPSGEQFVLVEIDYTTPAPGLGVWGTIQPAEIRYSCPISSTLHVLWTPPEIEPIHRVEEGGIWSRFANRLFGVAPTAYSPFRAIDLPASLANFAAPEDATPEVQFGELVRRVHSASNKPRWRELINEHRRQASGLAETPRLFIDQAACSRWRITPDSPLPAIQSEDAAAQQWLRAQGLALASIPKGLLLTTPSAAKAIGKAFSAEIDDDLASLNQFGVNAVPENRWLAQANAVSQWPSPTTASTAPELASWNCMIQSANSVVAEPFRVVRPCSAVAIGAIVVLCCGGLLTLFGRSQLRMLVLAAVVFAAAALLTPVEWVDLPRSLFWGALAAIGLSIVWRQAPITPPGGSTITSALFLAFALSAGAIWSQETEEAPVDSQIIWPVIFPIDEQGNAVGDYCFPAKPFYDALQQQADAYRTESRDWLFVDADWYIDVAERDLGEADFSPEVTGVFTIVTNRSNAQVILPVDRLMLLLKPEGSTLNGEPVDLRSEESGLSVEIADKGEHTLRVAFQGRVDRGGGLARVRFNTPPIPLSTIRVKADEGLETIEFPEAPGVVSIDRETGELVAANGGGSVVAVEWPLNEAEGGRASVVQNAWVFIDAQGVRCDYKVDVVVPDTMSVRRVVLTTSKSMKLTARTVESPIAKISPLSSNELVVDLDRDYSGVTVPLKFSFALKDSALGKIFLPKLRASELELVSETVAVSVDKNFNYAPLNDTAPASVTEFAQSWPSEQQPDWAIQAVGDSETSLLVTPAEKVVHIDSMLNAVVGYDEADIEFSGRFDLQGIDHWGFELSTENVKKINLVELLHNGEAVEFAANTRLENKLSILSTTPLSGEVEIRISATSVIDNHANWKLPEINLDLAQVASHNVLVYREDNALVRVAESAGYDLVSDAAVDSSLVQRLVGQWSLKPQGESANAIRLNIQPNEPQAAASIAFTMSNEDSKWFAEAEIHVTAMQGVVDGLMFEAPHWWADKIEPIPDAQISVTESADPEIKVVEIRPTQPVSQTKQFRIRGEVQAAAGRRIQLPQISLIHCELRELFVVVPSVAEDQRLNWRLSNLMPAALLDLFEAPVDLRNNETFRSDSDSPQAVLQTIRTISSSPVIRLADIRIDADPSGNWRGAVSFDLTPAGMKNCTIVAPQSVSIEQIRVADRPAVVELLSENKYRVALADEQLPQRIDVLYSGELQVDGVFVSPSMQQVNVTETLWTIRRGHSGGRTIDLDTNRKSAGEQVLRRYRAACEMVRNAANTTSEKSLTEAAAWYTPWMRRIVRLERELENLNESSSEIESLVVEQFDIAERLELESVRQTAVENAQAHPGVAELVNHSRYDSAAGWAFQGEKYSLKAPTPMGHFNWVDWRMVGAALLLALVVGAGVWLAGYTTVASAAYRWPHAALAVVGLIWWLAASPSFVGVLIVVFAAVGSLISPWRRVREI